MPSRHRQGQVTLPHQEQLPLEVWHAGFGRTSPSSMFIVSPETTPSKGSFFKSVASAGWGPVVVSAAPLSPVRNRRSTSIELQPWTGRPLRLNWPYLADPGRRATTHSQTSGGFGPSPCRARDTANSRTWIERIARKAAGILPSFVLFSGVSWQHRRSARPPVECAVAGCNFMSCLTLLAVAWRSPRLSAPIAPAGFALSRAAAGVPQRPRVALGKQCDAWSPGVMRLEARTRCSERTHARRSGSASARRTLTSNRWNPRQAEGCPTTIRERSRLTVPALVE